MNKKYRVRLTDAERNHLEKLVRKGKAHTRKLLYARILLKADEDGPASWTDERIAGEDLLAQEALSRHLERMRAEIAGSSPTPLERLLVDRVVICWLQLYETETRYVKQAGLSMTTIEYHQKRIDRLQRRYIAAIKALAQVRRLLSVPAAQQVQVNIGENQINVGQAR